MALSGAMIIRTQGESALVSKFGLAQQNLDVSGRRTAAAHNTRQALSLLPWTLTDENGSETRKRLGTANDYRDDVVRSRKEEVKQLEANSGYPERAGQKIVDAY